MEAALPPQNFVWVIGKESAFTSSDLSLIMAPHKLEYELFYDEMDQ